MASPTTARYREENQQQLWALVPFGARSPITKPVFFYSPDEVRRCWSIPIFVGWDEHKNLETRADWLRAVESDVPAPIVLSLCEEMAHGFLKPKRPKSRPPIAKAAITALYEQCLAARTPDNASAKFGSYVLERYGFRTFRLYLSVDKKRAARIFHRRGSEAFLQFMNWRRSCVNPSERFQNPAPVHILCDDRGPICNVSLSDYVKPDELNSVPGDSDTFIGSCLAHPLVQQCLYHDWNFGEIQKRASYSEWHQAPERKLKIRNARVYFAHVVLELDAALRTLYPDLSATALLAFWTSWEVSDHLTMLERRIEEYAAEPGAVSADGGELGEAQAAIESIIRQYVTDCGRDATITDERNRLIEETERLLECLEGLPPMPSGEMFPYRRVRKYHERIAGLIGDASMWLSANVGERNAFHSKPWLLVQLQGERLAARHWPFEDLIADLRFVRSTLISASYTAAVGSAVTQGLPIDSGADKLGSASPGGILPVSREQSRSALAAGRQKVVMPLLDSKGWTRCKWATKAGVGKNCVYEYLKGQRSLSQENREALAEEIGLNPGGLPE